MAKKAHDPLQRKRWRPVVKVWSLICGLLAGVGTAVLLQQYGVHVLDRGFLVRQVVLCMVLAVVLPSAARAIGVHRYNSALDKGMAAARARRVAS